MKDKSSAPRDMRKNNLDSLRLILASLVVLEHANNLFHLAKADPSRFSFFLLNLSDVAVSAFFVISGMLTYISYQRDPDIIRFYLRRMFRIFPAYWSVVLLQVIVFCTCAMGLVLWDRLPFYLLANAITANFLSPSFLEGIPAINGSLWTIKIEASYYLLLPLLYPLLRRTPTLAFLAVISLLWAVGFDHDTLAKQLPGKLYLFAAGIGLARIAPRINDKHSLIAMTLIPFGIVAKFTFEGVALAEELAVATLGICLVVAFTRQWVKREPMDISYTLYLVHYPVLVMFTQVLMPDLPFAILLLAGLGLSISIAVAISVSIERPTLAIGRRLTARAGKSRGGMPDGSLMTGLQK